MLAGVDYRDHELIWKRHCTIFEGRTVEQQDVSLPPERGGELVHDAHLHARRFLFGALACERCLLAVDVRGDPRCNRNQQRRRGAEPGPRRNVRRNIHDLRRRTQLFADGSDVVDATADVAVD